MFLNLVIIYSLPWVDVLNVATDPNVATKCSIRILKKREIELPCP